MNLKSLIRMKKKIAHRTVWSMIMANHSKVNNAMKQWELQAPGSTCILKHMWPSCKWFDVGQVSGTRIFKPITEPSNINPMTAILD